MKPTVYADRKKLKPKPDGTGRYVMDSLKSHSRPLPYIPKNSVDPKGPDSRGKTT